LVVCCLFNHTFLQGLILVFVIAKELLRDSLTILRTRVVSSSISQEIRVVVQVS